MHVKKDQRTGLQAHTQKCIFIGYPSEYKGWLFYNPDTKKTIISNNAEFDERLFPGLSQQSSSIPSSTLPSVYVDSDDEDPVDYGGG